MSSLVITGIVRIATDAEARKSATGMWYTFQIAAYRKFVPPGKQDVDIFNATIYSKNPTPELTANLVKGNLMFIEGANLFNDKFTGKDGQEKSMIKVKIIAYEFFNPAQSAKEEAKLPAPKPASKPVPAKVIPMIQVEDDLPPDDEEPPF